MIGLLGLALAASPDALLDAARLAERAGDPVAERDACEALLNLAPPDAAAGQRCAQRLAHLRARQDPDGGFSALSRLNALRRLPADPARIQAEALYAEPGLPEALRRDLALWLARDAVNRGEDPRPFLADWPEAEPAQRAARDALLAVPARAAPRRGPPIAAALLAIFALLCLPLSWSSRSERPAPYGLAALLFIGLGFALIAGRWEPRAGWATLALLPPLGLVHLLSLYALRAERLTAAVRALSGAATLASFYLVLWRFELLDRVGL